MEATEQLWLRYRLSTVVADSYARAGFTAVVQDVVLGHDLSGYLELFTTSPRYLVVLAPRPAVISAREDARGKKGYGEWTVSALDTSLCRDTPPFGLWLDNSDQRPEETVDEILANLPQAQLAP